MSTSPATSSRPRAHDDRRAEEDPSGRTGANGERPARADMPPLPVAIAAAAGGLLAFGCALAAYLLDGRVAPLDPELLRLARDVARDLPPGLAGTLTDLGALPSAVAVALVGAIVLIVRGHARAALTLALGLLALVLAVQLAKAGVGRVRPPGHDPSLQAGSFPSGHSAHSTTWVATAVAVTSATRAAGRRVLAALLVLAGALVAITVGATRMLLNAHYLSDVVGGWGLGIGVFGLVAAATVGVGRMRHTRGAADRRESEPVAAQDA